MWTLTWVDDDELWICLHFAITLANLGVKIVQHILVEPCVLCAFSVSLCVYYGDRSRLQSRVHRRICVYRYRYHWQFFPWMLLLFNFLSGLLLIVLLIFSSIIEPCDGAWPVHISIWLCLRLHFVWVLCIIRTNGQIKEKKTIIDASPELVVIKI